MKNNKQEVLNEKIDLRFKIKQYFFIPCSIFII